MSERSHEIFTGQTAAAVVKGNGGVIDSTGKIAVSGANAKIDGIVTRSAGSGEGSGLAWGRLTVVASEAITAGAELTSAASGQFEASDAAVSEWVCGKAITAASGAGVEFTAWIYPPGGGYVKA